MRHFFTSIVRHPKQILIGFIAVAVLCAVLQTFVGVNYDMKDYLPEDSSSTVSLDIMNEEYDGGIPNARVMVRDVTIPEALEYKERLEEIDGVSAVNWLDDSFDITKPLELADEDTLDTWYKDGNALYSVTIDEASRVETVDAIRALIGDDNAMTGEAVSTALATTSTVDEIRQIACIAIIMILVILFITTTSWAEPPIVLLGLGVAVLINMGTNLIFGEISFVSNAAGAILQIAVSLDYSVFLIHRYEECLESNPDRNEAMVDALTSSLPSILSSGLTTVIGFIALLFMKFRIGPDLGAVLAKGICISLITVFVFMPALIIEAYPLMHKTAHQKLLPDFNRFGRLICRAMLPAVCISAILVIPSYLASNQNSYYYGSSHIFGSDTQYGTDTEAIDEIFGKSDTYVVMVPVGDAESEAALSDALHEIPEVKNIISYTDTVGASVPEEYLDVETLSQLVSEHYTRMVLTVDTEAEGEQAFALVKEIRDTIQEYYPVEAYLAGDGVSSYDLMDTITADTVVVNLIAIASVFVVLLFSMRSIVLPVILVLTIETAIWINMAIPYFQGSTIFYIAYLIISSVQLGATVDYAILFTDRYMGFRQEMEKHDAIAKTVSTVTGSIITSGSVMTLVGMLLGRISSHGVLAELGTFLGKGTLLSMIMVFFVLPGLLSLFDGVIERLTRNANFYHARIRTKHAASPAAEPAQSRETC